MISTLPVAYFVATIFAIWLGQLVYELSSSYKRMGKSRLRTFITRELPTRWSLDKYGVEGYEKYHTAGKPFLLKVFGLDYWVMPPKYLIDLKTAKTHTLSFFGALSEAFNMQASVGNLYKSTVEITVVAKHLNSQLSAIVPLLADEAKYAVEKELGYVANWKSVPAATTCAKLLHRTTSRILVGLELCRNEEYLDVSSRFSQSLFIYGTLWNFVGLGPLRKFFAWLTIGRHVQDLHHATRMLLPVIHQRLSEQTDGIDVSAKYRDMLQWILDTPASVPGDDTPTHQAYHLMHLTFAASSASGVLVTQGLFQLLMFPKYLEPLRAEVEESLSQQKGWTDTTLNSMNLMDSFLRETMRMYPAGSLTCARTVEGKAFTFHDGLQLPCGSRIIYPALAIHMDPANYKDPETFEPFRFVKSDDTKSIAASTVTSTFLQFGYGAHACPGRFYAVRKAKLVLGQLIQRYDFRWDGNATSRPPGISIEAQMVPSPDARISIKSRTR